MGLKELRIVWLEEMMIPQLEEVGLGLFGYCLWRFSTSSLVCLTFPCGSQEFSASE